MTYSREKAAAGVQGSTTLLLLEAIVQTAANNAEPVLDQIYFYHKVYHKHKQKTKNKTLF